MEILVIAGISALFLGQFMLGWAESHWIAPLTLYLVTLPLILAAMWIGFPPAEIAAVALSVLATYYAAFALGRFSRALRTT